MGYLGARSVEPERGAPASRRRAPEQLVATPHQSILDLQRSAGNAAVAQLLQGAAGAAGAPAKDIKLTIAADKEAEWWTPEWYEGLNVGHSWIMLEQPDGTEDSYGFWPAGLDRGGGFDAKKPWADVPGEVRHPDASHQPNAKHTVEIDASELTRGVRYATGMVGARYNLLTYNCTTFARELFAAATGQAAPSAGLLIDDPNDLAKSIAAKNKAKGLDPLEQPLHKLTIAADKEADWWTPEWYERFNVGHSWVMVEKGDGTEDSYGFWPANLGRGGGFDPKRPWKDVDGEVRHPDTAHRPTATHTVEVEGEQLRKGLRYADGKKNAMYNLLGFNCTTFARELFTAASGQTAPSGGLLIDDPNDLAKSIAAKNKAKGLDPLEQPLPAGQTGR